MCQFTEKREFFFNNIDLKVFEDNRKFWKAIKPLFSDKHNFSQRNVIIEEKGKLISNNTEVAEILNNYFIDAVESLDIDPFIINDSISEDDTEKSHIENIINKYETHPSILKIKENVSVDKKFVFNDICSEEIYEYIYKLDPKKAGIENHIIPASVLVSSIDIVSTYLTNYLQ